MTGNNVGPHPQQPLRDYLLGALSEAEMEAAEQRYFADGTLLAEYEHAEDDLIDDYLSGRLDATQSARFAEHYLANPKRRVRYDLVRALRQRVPPQHSARRAIPFGALAAGIALVSVTLYLFYGRQSTSLPVPTEVLPLTLPSIQLRSDQNLPIAPFSSTTSQLELRLSRGERTLEPPLEVEIRSVAGVVVWTGPATPSHHVGREDLDWSVRIPAEKLESGDYLVELRSLARPEPSEADRYAFRVVRR